MDSKELPAHPSLEEYKKQGKDLLKSAKSGLRETLQLTLHVSRRTICDSADLQTWSCKAQSLQWPTLNSSSPGSRAWKAFFQNFVFPLSSAGSFVCRFIEGLLRQAAKTEQNKQQNSTLNENNDTP